MMLMMMMMVMMMGGGGDDDDYDDDNYPEFRGERGLTDFMIFFSDITCSSVKYVCCSSIAVAMTSCGK